MRPSYNNDQRIASNQTVSSAKLVYYQIIGALYSLTGYAVDLAFVNSTWTERHMREMWRDSLAASSSRGPFSRWFGGPKTLITLFPPCNTQHLQSIPLGQTCGNPGETTDLRWDLISHRFCQLTFLLHLPPALLGLLVRVRKRYILSVGQFRPEKDHALQIL
jgi:alpha-1,2-mannosyltransferase